MSLSLSASTRSSENTDAWRDYQPFLVDVINGRSPEWKSSWDDADFITACQIHGVTGIVADCAKRKKLNLPLEVFQGLKEVLDSLRVFELLHTEQLRLLFGKLESAGVSFILLKGTALAYSVFSSPHLRSRGDTDLFIAEGRRSEMDASLLNLGYERQVTPPADLSSYQQIYSKTDHFGYDHIIDVHWRISNRQVFANAFTWEELEQHTSEIPDLWPKARSLNPEYLLLHLCLHRVGHFTFPTFDEHLTERGDRLLWLYDIALVCRELESTGWIRFSNLCKEKQMCAVVLDTLAAANAFFPFNIPEQARALLAPTGGREPSRRLLDGGFLNSLVSDLAALPSWTEKITLLTEHLFPPSNYMLFKYEKQSRLWLPLLYIRRLAGFRP